MSLRSAVAQAVRSHRHVTRANASVVGIVLLAVVILLVGSTHLRPSAARTLSPVEVPVSAPPVTTSPPPAARGVVVLPVLPRLHNLIQATVLVSSERPLSEDLVRRATSLAGAHASLLVAVGDVTLGRGRTRALAADPVKTRVWTAPTTGRATGVWQRAVIGEAVVAHTVAKANAVALGGSVLTRRASHAARLRVGAYATTELPGVGLVVNREIGSRLGLQPRTGLLLAVTDADPALIAAELKHGLGPDVVVDAVLGGTVARVGWVPPAIGPVTSPFGMRVHPITGLPQFHDGIDIGAPVGAPVYAMSSGEVLYAGAATGFGSEIVLSHPGGVTTVYGHVSQILVSSGPVEAGQVIALVGNEGESTGPHLHAEVHVQDQPVDPVAWLEAHGVRFNR